MEMTNKEVSTIVESGIVRPSHPEINTTTEASNIPASSSPTNSQLLDLVRKQVEYYFSKENLASDSFLVHHMDASMSVPISVIMKFPKIKSLTQDEAIVRQALENSASSVSIVDNRLKANVKNSSRSTIILREIPSDTPVDEVKEIFNYDGCKPISSLRSEIGDSWFVSFESEEFAKDTLLDLRTKKRTFRGQSVKARLKTETVVKSYFPVQTAPPIAPVFPLMGYPGMGMMGAPMPINLQAFGYLPAPFGADGMPMPMVPIPPAGMIPTQPVLLPMDGAQLQQLNVLPQQGIDVPLPVPIATAEESKGPAAPAHKENNAHRDRDGNAGRKGGNKSSGGNNNGGGGGRGQRKSNSGGNNNGSGSNNLSSSSGNSSNHHGGKDKDKKDQSSETVPRPLFEINSANFPPLLSQADESTIPTPGYKDNFLKYSFDEIITIVKTVKEAILPPPFNPAVHPVSMTTSPNWDLLKRQRTFSIDETREQLVQGRPVQREAVISGTVDVRSLLFGDEGVATSAPASSNSSSNSKSSSGSHPVPSYKTASSGGATNPKGSKTETPAVKPSAPASSSVASKESSAASADAKVSTTVSSSTPVSTPQPPIDVEAAKPATEVAPVTEKVTEGDGATQNSAAMTQSSIVDGLKSLSTDDKPQKITPSTWAAMVMKSSAAATAESSTQTPAPLRPKQSSSTYDKKPKNGVSQAAVKPSAGVNAPNGAAPSGSNASSEKDITDRRNNNGGNSNSSKDRERDSRRRSDRPRDRDRDGAKSAGSAAQSSATAPDRKDSKTLPGLRDDNNSKENGNESSNITAVGTPTSPAATGWGGKTSFANILKKAPEETVAKAPAVKEEPASSPVVAVAHPPVASSSAAPPVAATGAPSAAAASAPSQPPTSSSSSTPSSSSTSTSKVSGSHHNSNHAHYNHAVPRKATAPVEANGVWVKETLPALKAADK